MAKAKGSPKTGGRKKGSQNKATAGLKAAFQEHEKKLVKALLDLVESMDEHVRIKAIQACFDRGWGRPAQPWGDEDGDRPPIVEIRRIIIDAKGNTYDPEQRDGNGAAKPDGHRRLSDRRE